MSLSSKSRSKSKREKHEVSTARPRRRNAPWMSPTRELFATAESLALQIYPWPRLELEVAATEGVLGLPGDIEARLPRAIWWAVFQLFGADDGEAFNAIFPCISRAVQKDEWRAISGVAPITTDELTVGKIVAFVAAARALLIEEPLAERTQLLKLLIEAGTEMRELWIKEIDAARAGEEGQRLIGLGDGWVRFEDIKSTAALKRVLDRNRPTSKSVLV
jgi:hypothetical protein